MKFLLLGKGKSIKYIIKYLKRKKCEYVIACFKDEIKNKNELLINEDLLKLDDITYVIKSPGINETNKIIIKLKEKFIFISEIDLLSLFNVKTKSIVVTGSNGKTTLVSLIYHLFKKQSLKVIKCGNSFLPISKYYKKFNRLDYLIIEQSSFQLATLKFYKPYISIILNMSPNHLDSSFSLTSYYENKKNIYKYQTSNEYFIYDNENKNLKSINSNAMIVSLLKTNIDVFNDNLKKYELQINYLYTISKIIGLKNDCLKDINDFKTLKYREEIKVKNNITYINDSKSTSVDATLFALSHVNNLNNTILIIGGKDKNVSLKRINKYKVKYLICYGEIVNRAVNELNNLITCTTLKEAFTIASNIYIKDKIILFSPAASSFDQYPSFEKRGKEFNDLIAKAKNK